jgi:hypothetical protein
MGGKLSQEIGPNTHRRIATFKRKRVMDESPKAVIRTSATALHNILADFNGSGQIIVINAWAEALQAPKGTYDFAERHAEVMGLWMDVRDEIKSLTPESLRKRLERSMLSWWNAIVLPDSDWENATVRSMINPSDLDMLATVGDLVESQLGSLQSVSVDSDLNRLREECEDWLSIVGDTDEVADEAFRQTLLSQISHLIWLIDNASFFGIPRIVRSGDQITGTLIRATAGQGKIKNTSRIRGRINSFVTALTLVANLIHSSQVIYDAGDHALPAAERIIREITDGNPGDVKPGHGNPGDVKPDHGDATEQPR